MPATKKLTAADIAVGSTSVLGHPSGVPTPAGAVHLVDLSWKPLCGEDPVSYVFPGRNVDTADACPRCTASLLPRPRTARK